MKKDTVKVIARVVVGFSTGGVITAIVKNNVASNNPLQTAEVVVASFALSGMISEYTQAYSDRIIDDVADAFNSFKKTESK